ncbi:MAG: beta-lactamase family protein [Acidobacteria bacterium]|nr:beta-lactamase family protein [Acidobacteriota bacterium]
MLRKRLFLFVILLLLLQTAAARADKVDDYVKSEMRKQRIPGLSLAVVRDGKVIKAEGYGLANVEHNIPARPETVYKIGSVSKQFIATGIMLLVQEGKVGLDERVGKYLDGAPESWSGITIRQLLTHTSGIVREGPGFDPFKDQKDFDVIKTAYPLQLRFKPGEKYEYCNVGYFSLAEIISRVSGKPWADFMTERVFAPLGMTGTRATSYSAIVPNRAGGYEWRNDRMRNAVELIAVRPSGAFLSSALDLAKWDAALYTDAILKQPTREQMWTPVRLNSGATHPYGLGWSLDPMGKHRQVHHGGTLSGFRSHFSRLLDDKLSIIVLTNCASAEPAAIVRGVAANYLPDLVASAAK